MSSMEKKTLSSDQDLKCSYRYETFYMYQVVSMLVSAVKADIFTRGSLDDDIY